MYDYLIGKVSDITSKSITLEVDSIGYLIKTPNPYNFKIDETKKIYTYLHIREDLNELYGFETKEERNFFLSLISVKGLGTKGALVIIASCDIDEAIKAIDTQDSKYLEKFPGIGHKLSLQIILDLSGKLNFNSSSKNSIITSVSEALKNLGYKASEIKKVEPVIEKNSNLELGELIKKALKAML